MQTDDGNRVNETANNNEWAIHEYKEHGTSSYGAITWKGQTTYAPALSTVYMDIYNVNTLTWDTIASNNTAGEEVEFTLYAFVNLTNYYDVGSIVTIRVRQKDI